MSNSENSSVKELKAAIEEDQRTIRALRDEIDRLRYLLGLHSLKKADAHSGSAVSQFPRKELHPDFSN